MHGVLDKECISHYPLCACLHASAWIASQVLLWHLLFTLEFSSVHKRYFHP